MSEDLDPSGDDGSVATGGVVRHPEDERVAMVRTHGSGESWVLPGGGVEPEDENLEATLRREVLEETGLRVAVERPLLVERQTFVAQDESNRSTTGWFLLFPCTATDTTFASDPGEHDDEIAAVAWHEEPAAALAALSDAVRDRLRETVAD